MNSSTTPEETKANSWLLVKAKLKYDGECSKERFQQQWWRLIRDGFNKWMG